MCIIVKIMILLGFIIFLIYYIFIDYFAYPHYTERRNILVWTIKLHCICLE